MKKRTLKFYAALILIFTALTVRVFFVMRGDDGLAVLSTGRRYSVKLTEQRGDILDRNGASLVDGESDVYAVCVPPLKSEYAVKRLAEAAGVSPGRVTKAAESGMPFAFKVSDRDLRLENIALLEVPRRFPSDGVARTSSATSTATERAFPASSGRSTACSPAAGASALP